MLQAKARKYGVAWLIVMMALSLSLPAFPGEERAYAAAAPLSYKFDFGTSSSPVAAGYTGVADSSLYAASVGYGLNKAVASRLRTGGDDMTNDFVLGLDYQFIVDIPNGLYDVTVYSGDLLAGTSATNTTVALNGSAAGTIQANQSVNSATYRATVTGGQLIVGITGTGAGGYLNGLVIEQVSFKFDFGTSSSPVAAGYTGVADSSLYSTNVGYGLNQTTASRLRTGGDDMTNDFVLGLDYQFIVDIPNGLYNVTVYSGDLLAGTSTTKTTVALNGQTAGTIQAKQAVNSATYRAKVIGGQLVVGITGPGAGGYLNGLVIEPVRFDFGSASSPVAGGYLQVTDTMLYTPEIGYGLSKQINYRDRGAPDDLRRDFVMDNDYSFRVDLPNGQYNVKFISGDSIASNNTTVSVDGIALGTLSSSAGQFAVMDRSVTVNNGYLELHFGSDGRINALEITPLDMGVILTDNGGTFKLQNSQVNFTVDKASAFMSSLYYTASGNPTLNLLGGSSGKGYYIANYSVGSTSYQKGISNAVFKVVSRTEDRVEVAMTVNDPNVLPFYLEVHMALEKDSPGMYYYTIYKYTSNMPDGLSIGQLRYAFALGDSSFKYFQVDDERGIQQKPTDAELNGATKLQDATYLLNGESLSTGRIWTKYQNISNTEGDNHVFMATNGQIGVSLIQAGKEWFDGGPTKQELTVHDYYDGEILLWHEHTGHYGTPAIEPAKGWGKVYGPFYLYLNQGSNSSDPTANMAEIWSDAKSRADLEQAKWPYTWISDPLYAANSRSNVSGTLSITDGSSANRAWIVLSAPGADWQTATDGYVYYTRADASGRFTVRGVRPGTYKLTAFVDGVPGEFLKENVAVGTAAPLNLGTLSWTPAKYGTQLWQIGTPNRSAKEFHVYGGSNGFREHLTWLEYPYEFPNGVDFKIGTSDITKDWNYFQPMFKTPGTNDQLQLRGTPVDRSLTEWKIRFNSNGYTSGTATLNIALASSVFGTLQVKINGTAIATYPTLPGPSGDNALYRQAIGSIYRQLDPIQFNASMIKSGENIITLSAYRDPQAPTSDDWMVPMSSIMYDYLRLEVQ